MVEAVNLSKKGRLFGVSFRLEKGGLALLGPNGAGKSTLLDLLAGRLLPSGGEARLFSQPPRSSALSRLRAYVPQSIALPAQLRVEEVLEMARRVKNLSQGEKLEAMERMGLGPWRSAYVGRLSGGLRQRLALALALMGNPPLWLLDEPASALDPGGLARLLAWGKAHLAQGGLILVSAHRFEEVEGLTQEVLVLAKGRTAARLRAEEVYTYRGPDGAPLEGAVREINPVLEVIYADEA